MLMCDFKYIFYSFISYKLLFLNFKTKTMHKKTLSSKTEALGGFLSTLSSQNLLSTNSSLFSIYARKKLILENGS